MEMNALTNWDKIVEASKDGTVLFNMIDVGDYFDAAVQSLALVRGIPMVLGGTFQVTDRSMNEKNGAHPSFNECCWFSDLIFLLIEISLKCA